ncbi:2OG-Fe(II) oxygenase [Phenylobacterium sp. LH3H17]|uniref:2OG-Fe(II) oxygenase n=1 Tax=Phenylobacterium sp. LH3H17 TaxID=2903901 RepID=UPI0020CA0345|nr:2OG-Fe(II) oxygenase family protein [Phenylobacterium sp. LH3H17]UTP39349.1 2OG-Fe(II) oxygenase [Phenylobacterium sp. LH3H17]
MAASLKIDPKIDPERLAPAFQAKGRLHIPDFFKGNGAKHVADALAGDVPWVRTMVVQGKGVEAPLAAWAMPSPQRMQVEAHVIQTARSGFQYSYDAWRISDAIQAGRRVGGKLEPIEAVYDFVNGEEFLGFVRKLTADERPTNSDAHASRYGAGHFLNTHHDGNADSGRLYAYVLNLTPQWQTDWGGVLLFQDDARNVTEGFPPRFNALNIFRVPQHHSVSQVATFVNAYRYSITGWVRRTVTAKPKR